MFNSKNNLSNLMEQAKQMQEKMQQFQKEIVKFKVKGESGAGVVKVIIDGGFNCHQVEIDHSVFEDDKEILEDLLAAAFNDAVRRVEEMKKKKIALV